MGAVGLSHSCGVTGCANCSFINCNYHSFACTELAKLKEDELPRDLEDLLEGKMPPAQAKSAKIGCVINKV